MIQRKIQAEDNILASRSEIFAENRAKKWCDSTKSLAFWDSIWLYRRQRPLKDQLETFADIHQHFAHVRFRSFLEHNFD